MAINRMHAESAIQVGEKMAKGFEVPLAKYSQIRYGDRIVRRYARWQLIRNLTAAKTGPFYQKSQKHTIGMEIKFKLTKERTNAGKRHFIRVPSSEFNRLSSLGVKGTETNTFTTYRGTMGITNSSIPLLKDRCPWRAHAL